MEQATRRTLQAEATRAEIVASARRLFAARGFGATSVADIARDAGVAIPTVYKSAGSKQAILHALVDAIDEEGGIGEGREALMAAQDARSMLHTAIAVTRTLQERCGDIIRGLASAAGADEVARGVLDEGERRHRDGMRTIARRMAQAGGLRVDPDEAGVVLALLTSRHTYAQLTGEYGWSFDRAQDWIERTLTTLLLEEER